MTDKVFSAKQVATRIGTDAKTLRKFFRSPASPFEAVGQGGRYEFPEKMLPEIKVAFTAWELGKGTTKAPAPKVNGKSTPKAGARKKRQPKIDREPGEHRGIPMTPPPRRTKAVLTLPDDDYVDPTVDKMPPKTKKTYLEILAERKAARDEEYGPEPTDEEIEELQLDEDEIEELKDSVNDMVMEELELDDDEDDD